MDFAHLDFRVGEIKECNPHPDSEKLYVSQVYDGVNTRTIGSGVKQFVPIEEMSGFCIILANLRPRKMIDFISEGMILFANMEN